MDKTTLIRKATVGLLVAFVIALSAYRVIELSKVSTAIIARGEARFYAWAFREKDLDPLEHIDSSFYRISAAILPLALVAATSLLLAPEDRSPEDAVVEETKFG